MTPLHTVTTTVSGSLSHCLCRFSATEDWEGGRRTLCLKPCRYSARVPSQPSVSQPPLDCPVRRGVRPGRAVLALNLSVSSPGNNINTGFLLPATTGEIGPLHVGDVDICHHAPSDYHIRSSLIYTLLHQELYYKLGIKVTSRLV